MTLDHRGLRSKSPRGEEASRTAGGCLRREDRHPHSSPRQTAQALSMRPVSASKCSVINGHEVTQPVSNPVRASGSINPEGQITHMHGPWPRCRVAPVICPSIAALGFFVHVLLILCDRTSYYRSRGTTASLTPQLTAFSSCIAI